MFKNIRRSRHAERLKHHYQRIETSLAMRQEYMQQGNKRMVLAVNYELVSDATRALDALRRIEELTPDHLASAEQKERSIYMRQAFSELVVLPALPSWRVTAREGEAGRVTPQEIDDFYGRFLRSIESSTSQTDQDPFDGASFWSRSDVRSLIAVVGMAILDMGQVEDILWPDQEQEFRVPNPAVADYEAASRKAVHDGTVLALAAERFRGLAEDSDEDPLGVEAFLRLPQRAHVVAEGLRDFAAWFGAFGHKTEREILQDFDRWERIVGPSLAEALEANAEVLHAVMSEDGPYELDAVTRCLHTILEDDRFDDHYRRLWSAVDPEGM